MKHFICTLMAFASINYSTLSLAQQYKDVKIIDQRGKVNVCGSRAIGPVTCNFFENFLNPQRNSELSSLCRRNNFGAINDGVIFKTRRSYNYGEIINLEYSNACPNKTYFTINLARRPARRAANPVYSTIAPNFQGDLELRNKPNGIGRYVIQAHYKDPSNNRQYPAGRSLPFDILGRN